jgi:hypothetical protein
MCVCVSAHAAVTAAICGGVNGTAEGSVAQGWGGSPRLTYDPQSSFVQEIMAAHARASAALLHLLRSEQEGVRRANLCIAMCVAAGRVLMTCLTFKRSRVRVHGHL